MQQPPSFNLWHWYRGLSAVKKLVYPFIAGTVYGISVLVLIVGYWMKTDLHYNLFSNGGWHAFSRCIVNEIKHDS